jgi:hypothetical protein
MEKTYCFCFIHIHHKSLHVQLLHSIYI